MAIFAFSADELYQWVVGQEQFLLLDVRNKKDFGIRASGGPWSSTAGPATMETVRGRSYQMWDAIGPGSRQLPSTDGCHQRPL